VTTLGNTHPALRRGWHPVALTSEVTDEPTGVELLGERYALVRLDGAVAAFRDSCPHRRAPLSAGTVVDGALECAYHGWRFDGSGRCIVVPSLGREGSVPPRARAGTPWGAAEHYGIVWIAPDEPVCDVIDIPELADARYTARPLPPTRARAGAGYLADNFLDWAHFRYLHLDTFGPETDLEVEDYSVHRAAWSFSVRVEQEFLDWSDPELAPGATPAPQPRGFVYRAQAPLQLWLRFDSPRYVKGFAFFLQPETEDCVRAYTVIVDDLGDTPEAEAERGAYEAWEQSVIDEDLAIQTRLVDLALPLSLDAEVHTRADRITVELRRMLADLVATTHDG
jgi:vanillate O-demethylase monooxygenase subunit